MNYHAIMKSRWLDLLKRTYRGWVDDKASRLSAALAYYSIFSIAPLLVIIRWRHVWFGALITGLLFEVGKTAVSWYLGREGTASAYGAAGSVVLVLMWVYFASSIFFLARSSLRFMPMPTRRSPFRRTMRSTCRLASGVAGIGRRRIPRQGSCCVYG